MPIGSALVTRRTLAFGLSSAIMLGRFGPAAAAARKALKANYLVTLISVRPLRLAVDATVPVDGDRLIMSDTYPAELPQMAASGWPALIKKLAVTDGQGQPVGTIDQGSNGWRLARPVRGQVRVRYIVDLGIFEAAGWSSPLESAIVDLEHAVICCRALFITTPRMTGADVAFRTPQPWRAIAPWPATASHASKYEVRSVADLSDNMLVISQRPPDIVTASGFTLQIVTMGHWRPLRPLVRQTLRTIVSLEAAMMGYAERETYNVVLLPTADTGGAAYRQSFVYCFEKPTNANREIWANTLAHEIFHYWNYSRLQGRDYASTQWFQEGFTEYVANLTLLVGKAASPEWFLSKISGHIANYRQLSTTLENIGTKKGKALYSAGALVAFSFDVMIRRSTGGKRTIGTFFRNLWRGTDAGTRKYAWADIEAALRATASGDWGAYYNRYIRGREPLPIEDALREVGLRLNAASEVEVDLAAGPESAAVWRSLNSRI